MAVAEEGRSCGEAVEAQEADYIVDLLPGSEKGCYMYDVEDGVRTTSDRDLVPRITVMTNGWQPPLTLRTPI
ncbi:hypothetical protein Nepgr_007461 [Nepenthes gracilis]|uniref:Uncharacterized protein n=1 Tax=Nepenthes gracilis TaxID=150966 RepID=A0AAD3S796_NEPGR|nr:hypothetical protein Nepgr_007461 [Nepenthes gracilis]